MLIPTYSNALLAVNVGVTISRPPPSSPPQRAKPRKGPSYQEGGLRTVQNPAATASGTDFPQAEGRFYVHFAET